MGLLVTVDAPLPMRRGSCCVPRRRKLAPVRKRDQGRRFFCLKRSGFTGSAIWVPGEGAGAEPRHAGKP
jgi:hypothetical protein